MKSLFTILILCVVMTTQAQTNQPQVPLQNQVLIITNGAYILTISNGTVVNAAPAPAPEPPLVARNGQVVPAAFVDAIAQATGIPSEVLAIIPLKGLFWLFVLSVGLPALARYLRKWIPDSVQNNKAGLALAHIANEVNPTIEKLAAAAEQEKATKAIQEVSNSTSVPQKQ
jgi:hypothetical protein